MRILVIAIFLICNNLDRLLGFVCSASVKVLACPSSKYKLNKCEVEEVTTIYNMRVVKKYSNAVCNYYDRSPETYKGIKGVFGFYGNVMWAHWGCIARYNVCADFPVYESSTVRIISETATTTVTAELSTTEIISVKTITMSRVTESESTTLTISADSISTLSVRPSTAPIIPITRQKSSLTADKSASNMPKSVTRDSRLISTHLLTKLFTLKTCRSSSSTLTTVIGTTSIITNMLFKNLTSQYNVSKGVSAAVNSANTGMPLIREIHTTRISRPETTKFTVTEDKTLKETRTLLKNLITPTTTPESSLNAGKSVPTVLSSAGNTVDIEAFVTNASISTILSTHLMGTMYKKTRTTVAMSIPLSFITTMQRSTKPQQNTTLWSDSTKPAFIVTETKSQHAWTNERNPTMEHKLNTKLINLMTTFKIDNMSTKQIFGKNSINSSEQNLSARDRRKVVVIAGVSIGGLLGLLAVGVGIHSLYSHLSCTSVSPLFGSRNDDEDTDSREKT